MTHAYPTQGRVAVTLHTSQLFLNPGHRIATRRDPAPLERVAGKPYFANALAGFAALFVLFGGGTHR